MGKFANKDEAKTALSTAKEERKAAKTELRAFEKENELEHDADHSGNAKVGKKWKKLSDAYANKNTKVEKIQGEVDGFKKEKVERVSKYEYPKVDDGKGGKREMTAGEKKKFRAKSRAEGKKAEKGESKKSKKKDKGGTDEGKEVSSKSSKKDKKAKKKEAAEVAEAVED
jgi:hypothetical protein